jgi:hypothetical protein
MSPTSGHQVTSALRLTLRKETHHCFKTLLFTDGCGAAGVTGTRFEMSNKATIGWLRARTYWGITAVVAAGIAAVEMSSPVTTALH